MRKISAGYAGRVGPRREIDGSGGEVWQIISSGSGGAGLVSTGAGRSGEYFEPFATGAGGTSWTKPTGRAPRGIKN